MKTKTDLQPFTIENPDQISILVVEENINDQLILHYLLRKQIPGVLPVGATSIRQAFVYLTNCRHQKQALPALILVDLYLPCRGDGWKLLRRIQAHPVYQSIPVVMVSSSMDLNDIEKSHQWGASGCITKPVTLEGWQEILQSIPLLMKKS